MREVEVSRFVLAHPRAVRRVLSPESVVAAEGTFTVGAVEETETGTVPSAATTDSGESTRRTALGCASTNRETSTSRMAPTRAGGH